MAVVGCDCEWLRVAANDNFLVGGDYVAGTAYLHTYVAGISHNVFFMLVRHSSWGPVFCVDMSYPKVQHLFSILDKCRNVGHVATCLKTYATKPKTMARIGPEIRINVCCDQLNTMSVFGRVVQNESTENDNRNLCSHTIIKCIVWRRFQQQSRISASRPGLLTN